MHIDTISIPAAPEAKDRVNDRITKLIHWYEQLLIVIVTLIPLFIAIYIYSFQEPLATFVNHSLHEAAIGVAILQSSFIGYVTWRCYLSSGEPLLRWLTLSFIGFTLIYALHGVFTMFSENHMALFLLYGPTSRLVMAGFLLTGLFTFGRPCHPLPQRIRKGFWLGWLSAFLALDIVVAWMALYPPIPMQSIRLGMEVSAMLLILAGIALVYLRRQQSWMMMVLVTSLAYLAQGSLTFIFAKPWNQLWWLAHIISAAGFIILSYGVIRAFRTTRTLSKVFRLEEVMEQLRESAVRYRSVVENASDGIFLADSQGFYIEVNSAGCKMLGYSREEILELTFVDILAPTEIPRLTSQLSNLATREQVVSEWQFLRKDGSMFLGEVRGTQLANGNYLGLLIDISERKINEQIKLQESDLRFRGTLEQMAVGIVHISRDGRFEQANQKFCDMVGYERNELMKMSFQDITYGGDSSENKKSRGQLLAGEIPYFSTEKRYVHKDQSLLWVNVTVSMLRNGEGNFAYLIGVIEDIADRKHAEVLAQQYGHLLQSSFNEIYLFDAYTLRVLLSSEGAERNLGYTDDEMHQLTLFDLSPTFNREVFEQRVAPLRSGKLKSITFESSHLRKDGTTYLVEVRLQLMEGDNPVFMAIVQDISERKKMDLELNQSRQLLRELIVKSEALREDERKRIARELHDELGQILTALRMNVAVLRIEFGERDAASLDKIKVITELLDQSIKCTREVVSNLRPVALDMGIVPAVTWLRDEFVKHTGTTCVLFLPEADIYLDVALAVVVFRVVQESLTNAARYAEASKVEITLIQDADNFSVTVNDNGKGFDYTVIPEHKSFGLLGMRERAIALGGIVNIYSAHGLGTQIFFSVPHKQTIIDTNGDQP